MKRQILKHLGFAGAAEPDDFTLELLDKAIVDVEELLDFHYIYSYHTEYQSFINNNTAYTEYLKGAEAYLLCATTLGLAVDKRLKRLQMEDMSYAVVFDAAASVILEVKADAFERTLPYKNMGFRFCPGYGGTSIIDNKEIAQLLHAERIGISFLESGLMIPLKSMTGIVKIGGEKRPKNCDACPVFVSCQYRRVGKRCYK